jgi:preprotein translocase subunit SecY
MSSELRQRLAFTLGALLVYRLGSYIPVPGLDLDTLEQPNPDERDFGIV